MKEISLNILDIAKNSVTAGANRIIIDLETDNAGMLTLRIEDNGQGMSKKVLENVTNPFYTTRTTRSVGLGLPFLKMAAELAGGTLTVESETEGENKGTRLKATFNTTAIDCMPMGDIISTICTLIGGSPEIDFVFRDKSPEYNVILDTAEMKEILGDVPLDNPDVQIWLSGYLKEQYETI